MTTSIIIILAIIFDKLWGEPRHFHPIVGFGNLASRLEKSFNPTFRQPLKTQIVMGGLVLLFLSFCFVTPVYWVQSLTASSPLFSLLLSAIVLYYCIAYRSLTEHVHTINNALKKKDIPSARLAVSMIVSRNTDNLSEQEICSASIESALENTNDALFGALFWFLLAGLPGVLIYRITNTLDAMWGYRTERFNYFGRAAAKLDDFLNVIPARLSALTFALVGNTRTAFHCWHSQAAAWKSPNAGVVMAAGSGALKLQLGGSAYYHGKREERPILGQGKVPCQKDINRTLSLVRSSLILWVVIIVCIDVLITYA